MNYSFSYPLPGSIVSVPIVFGYRHLGIVSDRFHGGKPMVISNSARSGGVYEEPWDVFSQGKPFRIKETHAGIGGSEAIRRARSLIGTRYDLFSWNCEHLVTFAQGLSPTSPQILATTALVFLGLALAARKSA